MLMTAEMNHSGTSGRTLESGLLLTADLCHCRTTDTWSNSFADVWCPHHPKDAAWWWRANCPICRLCVDHHKDSAKAEHRVSIDPVELDPAHRFGRWPLLAAYPVSTLRLPPEYVGNVSQNQPLKRKRRSRSQQRMPRLGSDTNPLSFTGGTLSIRRSALSLIGRRVEPGRTTNSSGFPWKC
jgi:hypothetical protein